MLNNNLSGLDTPEIIPHNSGGINGKIKVPAGLGAGEGVFHFIYVLLLCSHIVEGLGSLSASLIRTLVLLTRALPSCLSHKAQPTHSTLGA